MSFWRKFFGQLNQKTVEENLVVEDDASSEEQLVADEGQVVEDLISAAENPNVNEQNAVEVDLVTSEKNEEAELASDESIEKEINSEEDDLGETTEDGIEVAEDDIEAAEEQLLRDLEAAETEALNAQLEIEKEEFLEDLSEFDGRVLPRLEVPEWREELEFVKESYEPCDLSEHIVKVSRRRLTVRQIDHVLAESRLSAYSRYFERASRRFKDKIDEDTLLNQVLNDLTDWKGEHGKSVAWKLVERINEEVVKAKKAEKEATSFVANNIEFVNPTGVDVYREFARRTWFIPIATLYLTSVVGLTYNRFEWIMKFFPFFNLGLAKTLIMISGIAAGLWLSNLWKYSKNVAKIQRQLVTFKARYEEQHHKIKHSVKQHTRLAQQQPLVEPILRVLAKAYRVQLQSDVSARAQVTTNFDPDVLPACVTLARADDSDKVKMARLRRRALSVLMSQGWRTNGLNEIARIHADSKMLDSNSLSLKSLDTDSVVSASNAQKLLTDAFSNTEIHHRVSKARLVRAIKDLHKEVLANWDSGERPQVRSMRDDGFDKISFQSSWLVDENVNEDWINFLTEILGDETAPFSDFNILDKSSELNNSKLISSVAVVPHYFAERESKVKIEKSKSQDVMPMDIVVRVDVSPWSDPSAFAIFADGATASSEVEEIVEDVEQRMTSD